MVKTIVWGGKSVHKQHVETCLRAVFCPNKRLVKNEFSNPRTPSYRYPPTCITLPKTDMSPLKFASCPKRNLMSSCKHRFSRTNWLLVLGRVFVHMQPTKITHSLFDQFIPNPVMESISAKPSSETKCRQPVDKKPTGFSGGGQTR